MTGIPPVGTPPSSSEPGKKPASDLGTIQQEVDRTAKEAFATPQVEEKRGWGIWSWFGTGGEEDEEFYSDDEDQFYETYEDFEPAPLLPSDEVIPEERQESVVPVGNEEFRRATEKTQEVGKSWWSRLTGAVSSRAANLATHGIQSYAEQYQVSLDKQGLLAESKREMLAATDDPQYVEFFDLVCSLVIGKANGKISAMESGFLADNVKSQKDLILSLLEINLAKGFANLANRAKEKSDQIPHFGEQPALVSILSLLCQDCGEHLDAAQLKQMEVKYRTDRENFQKLKDRLFPGIDQDSETQKTIVKLIQTSDLLESSNLSFELFPDIDGASGERLRDIQHFIHTCRRLHQRHLDLHEAFSKLSDDILQNLFPHRFDDMEIPGFLKWGTSGGNVADAIYSLFIKESLLEVLQQSYEPLENDVSRNAQWKDDLQTRLGAPDLTAAIQAPSAFAIAFVKDFIQSNPKAVTMAAEGIHSLASPSIQGASKVDPKDEVMAQLSHLHLANWFVESVQTMLNSEDPHLQGIGGFVHQGLDNLVLALLSKGAKLAFPDGEEIKDNQLIKELTDRMVAKLSNLKGDETISDQFWKEFLDALPLPPLVKSMLLPIVIEKSKGLQKELMGKTQELKQIEALYTDALSTVRTYQSGDELLSIAEKISDQVVDQLVEQNVGLVSKFGLGDSFEEMFTQYLPGIKMDDELTSWIKANISAIGPSRTGQSTKSVELMRKGVNAVVLKALVNTIETNFKNDSEDYAAQLLQNIRQAFMQSIHGFGSKDRAELQEALKVHADIQAKKEESDELRKHLAERPQGLTPVQQSLLNSALESNIRVVVTKDRIESLRSQLAETLQKLNKGYPNDPWEQAELPLISEALVLHKMMGRFYPSQDTYKAQLEFEVEQLERQEAVAGDSEKQRIGKDIDVRQTLLNVLEMPVEDLRLISESVHLDATIKHAEAELDHFEKELKVKKAEVESHTLEKLSNRSEWEDAVDWMEVNLSNREDLHRLSREIAILNKKLDGHLKVFQSLSQELTALLGLDQKDNLKLPKFLQDRVWPLIESAKNEHISRLLFEQLSPMLAVYADADKNRDRLIKLSQGNEFLPKLAKTVSAETLAQLPRYVSNYAPFAKEMLELMGVDSPTAQDVEKMEASLRLMMIDLGREGAVASMFTPMLKGVVPKGKEEALSKHLEQWVQTADQDEMTLAEMAQILKKEIATSSKEEEDLLEKQAGDLSERMNDFLAARGKKALTAQDLFDAYTAQVGGPQVDVADEKKAVEDLFEADVAGRISSVVVTPNEIAKTLNKIIPGAKDLHVLIAPQLEALVRGDDPSLQAGREFVQEYIEALLLQLFARVAEANSVNGQSVMAVLALKLENALPSDDAMKVKTAEEIARGVIDEVLSEVLGITSQDDLDGIPVAMREMAYSKVKEQAYLQLTPMLLPMIELQQNRLKLQSLSGSKFLGSLCKALSRDLFTLLPLAVSSYRPIGRELFALMGGKNPTEAEEKEFAKEISKLVESNKQFPATAEALVEAYARVSKTKLSTKEKKEFVEKLEKRQALSEILNVLITPEQMAAAVVKAVPNADPKLMEAFAAQVQGLIHDNPDAYQHLSGFAEAYAEGMLVRAFIRIAENNPPQKGKDTLLVLTEKLLDVVSLKFEEAKSQPADVVARELNDTIMKELLGIDSPEAFEGLPPALKEPAYLAIKDQLGGFLVRLQQGLTAMGRLSETEVGEKTDAVDAAISTNLQILSEDVANMVVGTVPGVLTELGGQKLKGVNLISKGIESYIEDLARGNMEVAAVLLNYTKGNQFQNILQERLEAMADAGKLGAEKDKAADLLAQLILVPLNQALGKAVAFEEEKGAAFDQKLLANILTVAAGHMRNLNQAKELAAAEGRSAILHRDFTEAAGKKLHPAVPMQKATYEKTLDAIEKSIYGKLSPDQSKIWNAERSHLRKALRRLAKADANGTKVMSLQDVIDTIDQTNNKVTGASLKRWQLKALRNKDQDGFTLRDILREEFRAAAEQRQEKAYSPAAKTVMKMLFPNGKQDLTFVPEELRGTTWKVFEKNLFPVVLPMITELLLDPDVVNSMVLSSLQSAKESLSAPIVPGSAEEPGKSPDALDIASGAWMGEVMKMVQLPGWVKKQIADPKTGEVSPAMQQAMGAALRKQFAGTFLKDKVQMALEKIVERDENGKYLLKPDVRSKDEKKAEAPEKREAVQRDIKRLTREVVDVSIAYFIRSKWVEAQSRFDSLIAKAFGKIGLQMKQALDAVFGFIFFKIVGTILSILLYPIKQLVKEGIYKIISLDQNRELILSFLTKAPEDQPKTAGHVVYNEDLVYKLGEAVKETVEEFLATPIIPSTDVKQHKAASAA